MLSEAFSLLAHLALNSMLNRTPLVPLQGTLLNSYYPSRIPYATYSLIGLCVLLFWFASTNPAQTTSDLALYLAENPHFHYWQYLSSLFMHGSIAHLLLNMLGLWMFGSALEKLWGGGRFLLFFLICGIGAGLIYNWVNAYQFQQLTAELRGLGLTELDLQRLLTRGEYRNNIAGLTKDVASKYFLLFNTPTLGASGAIYGVLVAFAMNFPNVKLILIFLPIPIAAKYFVPGIILVDLFSGVTGFSIFGANVAHFAHVSGALVGFILVLLFRLNKQRSFA